MKIKRIIFLLLFVTLNVNAEITPEAKVVKHALNSGQQCSAKWGVESSKNGQETTIFDVREFQGKTQYQVFHSNDYPKIWTWDFRVENIKCNSAQIKSSKSKDHMGIKLERFTSIYIEMIRKQISAEQIFVNQKCSLNMRLSANGLLLDISDVDGNVQFCRAVKSGMMKVSQFPMPDDSQLVENLRNVRLTVTK